MEYISRGISGGTNFVAINQFLSDLGLVLAFLLDDIDKSVMACLILQELYLLDCHRLIGW